jgi:hypothetical protein
MEYQFGQKVTLKEEAKWSLCQQNTITWKHIQNGEIKVHAFKNLSTDEDTESA